MTTFTMALKDNNGLVFKTDANSLEEAYKFFAKMKQMSLKDFKELFIVSELKNKNQLKYN